MADRLRTASLDKALKISGTSEHLCFSTIVEDQLKEYKHVTSFYFPTPCAGLDVLPQTLSSLASWFFFNKLDLRVVGICSVVSSASLVGCAKQVGGASRLACTV